MKRGFRFQTGEIKEIARELKEKGFAEVDIDIESEIQGVFDDLKEYGIFFGSDCTLDYDAANSADEKEFFARASLPDGLYIDFYLVDQPEED
ncbi:MAG: hypothetical protein BWY15_00161 [Firmicutes bacterium ADurb.Bin193]|nr:MAG: hypothetical protein BWY15_00161 [Firmicutes bacterium ADurb.Bin193]